MQFTNSLIIERPVHEVFAFISDFENMPKWNYFVVEVRKTSPGQIGSGTTFHQRRKADEQDYTITEYEPDRKVTVTTALPMPTLLTVIPIPIPQVLMRFIFTPVGASTQLIDEWVISGGPISFLASLSTTRVKAAVAENLDKLKQLLETGHVQLQDGRDIRL
jgi:hypothetical protein